MIKELMPLEAEPEAPIFTCSVITYELGSLIHHLIHAKHTLDEKSKAYHLAEARIDLADLLTQAYLLAEQMGWKRLPLENDGLERFQERMNEVRKGGIK